MTQKYPDGQAPAHLIEVRCCCQPQKLLGWMPKVSGPVITLLGKVKMSRYGIEQVTYALPVVRITHSLGDSYLAIKAEGMTIEQLKKYPFFIPHA